ncbi:MAG: DNA primase, partial [Nitrospinota bacterium]
MALIPQEELDRVREGIPIEDVIGEYVALKKSGKSYKGLCPFHPEKTPSFVVSPSRGTYHCFGCGAGGNVFQFLMQHEGMGFVEAVELLARRQGIDLRRTPGGAVDEIERLMEINEQAARYFERELLRPSGEKARLYLKERGLREETVKTFRLGFAPPAWDGLIKYFKAKETNPELLLKAGLVLPGKERMGYYDRFRNRLIFPICNLEGRPIAFGGRALPGDDGKGAKYINSPDTPTFNKSRTLYGLHLSKGAIRERRSALVVEGYFDLIALWESGFKNAVAPLGVALTAEHVRALKGFAEELVFIFDPDAAGRSAARRGGEVVAQESRLVSTPESLSAGVNMRGDLLERPGLGQMRLRVIELPPGGDVDSLLRREGPESLRRLERSARGFMEYSVESLLEGTSSSSEHAEKVGAVRRVAAFLEDASSTLRREYVRVLSERLALSQELIFSLLQEGESGRVRRTLELTRKREERPPEEFYLVWALIQEPALATRVRDELDPKAFKDGVLRAIAEALLRAQEEGASYKPSAIVEKLEEVGARELAARLSVEELEEPEKVLSDCLSRMKWRSLKERSRLLQERITEAKRRGATKEMEALLR